MKYNFLNICIGVAIVLFATGYFIRSLDTAQATPRVTTKNLALPDAGEIMFQEYNDANGSPVFLVWNTVTGKSVLWKLGSTNKKYDWQLPTNPFE